MPAVLIAASAFVILALGSLHLLYTFHGPRLLPRDPALQTAMQAVSPRITRQTTMWRAWLGFNASHSTGAILFGLVYGYLALLQPGVLFSSWFLCAVGLAHLFGYAWMGMRFWFSVPFRGSVLAAALFAAGIALHLLQAGG